jgi:predicted polyphosphate/ATP-dependent NAD kinase
LYSIEFTLSIISDVHKRGSMSSIGIIANPASGRDIRRLVSHASAFDNLEKVNIIQRILIALDAGGVDEAHIMPDYFGLGTRSLHGLHLKSMKTKILEMPCSGMAQDSSLAADLMNKLGVDCIVVLGGDGTNRMVAKNSASTPILPVSTGTNNVFPFMVEGTIAGIAAGLVANKQVDLEVSCSRVNRIEITVNTQLVDIALVDLVTSSESWIGNRAIWEPSKIKDIVLVGNHLGNIGFSSIGSALQIDHQCPGAGMYIQTGPGKLEVQAPIAPGLMTWVEIADYRSIELWEEVNLLEANTIALDGEREIELSPDSKVSVCLTNNGPLVVNIQKCIDNARQKRIFQRVKLV